MNLPDEKFLDGLFELLVQASSTQIDSTIIINMKKFMSEQHTLQEKYDFIQNISKEPLNMISDKIGFGRISKFVKEVCDLDAIYCPEKKLEPTEPIIEPIPKGYVRKYGWDGKPIICKDESDESKISIQYIIEHQDKDKDYDNVLLKIMSYMDDLMWANKFHIVDEFILQFCEHNICFQYCLCLLTCARWASNKINSMEMLIEKTKKKGIEEIGEKDTNSCLKGLI